MNFVKAATLSTFEIFKALCIEDREVIAQSMALKRFEPSSTLISAAENRSEVFFLLSGTVRAFANSQCGKQVQYEDLTAGSMFGELSAIDGQPRGNDCIALDQVLVAVMTADTLMVVMKEHPAVMKAVMVRLATLTRKHMRRVYEFSTENVGTRVRLEILRMIQEAGLEKDTTPIRFDRVPTHSDIAARISTHREAVTRELKNLEKAGLIVWRPGNYVVHDTVALRKITLGT